ncbi:MAG: type II secretion system F family protein [Nanoarchaeota archaeon]
MKKEKNHQHKQKIHKIEHKHSKNQHHNTKNTHIKHAEHKEHIEHIGHINHAEAKDHSIQYTQHKVKEEDNQENKKRTLALLKNKKITQRIIIPGVISVCVGLLTALFTFSLKYSFIMFFVLFGLIELYFLFKELLKNSAKIKKMEEVFPDFIELMSANLRAGMTVDKALLLSSRKEFSPLDEEILLLGKDIMTGKEMIYALLDMTKRIKSDKILKTITVINSGIKSGGNLAVLLEQTATNMRERIFVEKKAQSNVLMYVIFIFFAITVGAPALFSLSTILVEVLTRILSGLPELETSVNLPFALTSINISVTFVMYFAIIFLIAIDTISALLIGLISKGEEKAGLKYIVPLISASLIVFFIVRIILLRYFGGIGV